jgi:hypothetical protein
MHEGRPSLFVALSELTSITGGLPATSSYTAPVGADESSPANRWRTAAAKW